MKVANELVYFLNPYCKPNTDLPSETLKATETGCVLGPQCMNPALPSASGHLQDQPGSCQHGVGGRQCSFWYVSVQTEKLFFVNSFKVSYCPQATESFSKHVLFILGYILESKCIYKRQTFNLKH